MAEIDIRKFVDINIQAPVVRSVEATRKTVVLFTPEGVSGTIATYDSYESASTALSDATFPNTLAYLKVYFDNGGLECKVVQGIGYSALTKAIITALKNEEIVIACVVPSADAAAGYTAIKDLAGRINADTTIYGVNEKILLARNISESDEDSVKNFIVKYSTILGAEMTIAAYFSQVNIYKENSIQDYCFTAETITAEDIDTTLFETLMTNNYNVDISLGGAVRDLGGNAKDGRDAINEYIRIILHQTLTQRLVNLLVTKLKNSDGVSKIYTTLVQELEIYRNAGYLTTDKVWTANDLTKVYNQQQYTIIEKGTPLPAGYFIRVLPMSALNDAQRTARMCPPVYVIIADQYGIRQITIQGEVI